MARTLTLTLSIIVDHLEGDELSDARTGCDDDEYPSGSDADLDETSPFEIGNTIADMLPTLNDEMWAGSGIFAKVARAAVVTSGWSA